MYARIVKMTLKDDISRADMEQMADDTYRLYKVLPGFVSATYLIYDEAKRECGSVLIFNTRDDAETGAEKGRAAFLERFGYMLAASPEAQLCEVYEPR